MRYILFASDDEQACETIRNCFRSEYRVDVASSKEACFDPTRKKRYGFIFVDVGFLRQPTLIDGFSDYKLALQSFWQEFPTAEIRT